MSKKKQTNFGSFLGQAINNVTCHLWSHWLCNGPQHYQCHGHNGVFVQLLLCILSCRYGILSRTWLIFFNTLFCHFADCMSYDNSLCNKNFSNFNFTLKTIAKHCSLKNFQSKSFIQRKKQLCGIMSLQYLFLWGDITCTIGTNLSCQREMNNRHCFHCCCSSLPNYGGCNYAWTNSRGKINFTALQATAKFINPWNSLTSQYWQYIISLQVYMYV